MKDLDGYELFSDDSVKDYFAELKQEALTLTSAEKLAMALQAIKHA